MVTRYTLMLFEHDAEMDPDETGNWVKYEDYLSLLGALREALEGWKGCHVEEEWERIEALKKQFLDI